jgi:threonine aldolase
MAKDTSIIRLVTSWATPEAAVMAFLKDLSKLKKGD